MLTALAAKGYPVPGTDPSKNLGTIMWRLQDKFVNINGHGFWIRGKAYLPANYTGESSTDLLE
jgi:hypothetical protein